MRFLQVAHTPNHVEDSCRDEEQPRDQTTQDRLRILENSKESLSRGLQATNRLFCFSFVRQKKEKKRADCQSDETHPYPKRLPRHAATNHWTDCKLSSRPAGHAKHLGCTNQRRGTRRREILRGDIEASNHP